TGRQRHSGRERHGLRAGFLDERDQSAGAASGSKRDTQERQEFHSVAIRDPIRPVEQCFDQKREALQDRDAGVGRLKVGPFGIVSRCACQCLVQKILEPAVVKYGHVERHRLSERDTVNSNRGLALSTSLSALSSTTRTHWFLTDLNSRWAPAAQLAPISP